MKILMIGDVYGSAGRYVLRDKLQNLIATKQIDFVVANGENATHGKSISYSHYLDLKNCQVDVITSGNHIFRRNDVLEYIGQTPDLLKPLNMNPYSPGNGTIQCEVQGKKIRVTNLMGRVYMDAVENPYYAFDELLKNDDSDIHLVDFHAEATAEKIAFAWNYDGLITAFVGTHTHVQTADERILPKGTAYITDLGMCGPLNSAIGADFDAVIRKEKYGYPAKFIPAEGPAVLCGLIIDIDDLTNKPVAVQRIMLKD